MKLQSIKSKLTPAKQQLHTQIPQGSVRQKTAERGYGGRWQRARAAYLAKHPLCVECQKQGLVTIATDLDHIIPHQGDMNKFWDFEHNIQPLCHSCHSVKTSAEDGGYGNERNQRRGGGLEAPKI